MVHNLSTIIMFLSEQTIALVLGFNAGRDQEPGCQAQMPSEISYCFSCAADHRQHPHCNKSIRQRNTWFAIVACSQAPPYGQAHAAASVLQSGVIGHLTYPMVASFAASHACPSSLLDPSSLPEAGLFCWRMLWRGTWRTSALSAMQFIDKWAFCCLATERLQALSALSAW